jgi:competence ComEA-like helix-hairpin-helix protein
MPKQFLASQVKFERFALNPPEFDVTLVGKIDGKGENFNVFFDDNEGTDESLRIVRQILGLLNRSYANPEAVGSEKLYLITVTVDDTGKKIIPPPAATSVPTGEKVAEPTPVHLIDVNSATADELTSLYGIGPVTAQAIIVARPFKSVDDLKSVSGIGDKLIESIRPLVTARQRPAVGR